MKQKAVNRTGVCSFYFIFAPTLKDWPYHKDKGLEPWKWAWDGNPQSLYDDKSPNGQGCKTNENGAFCTALIQYNDWQFPKDYPRKIRY